MAAYIAIPKLGMSMTEASEELEALQKEPAREIFTTVAGVTEEAPVEAVPSAQVRAEGGERIRISPVARKMAEEHMIDITKVTGTGPGGRIVMEDIEKVIEAKKGEAPPAGKFMARVTQLLEKPELLLL